MNFDSIINFMNQQSKVLKELEDLLAHDAKQENPGHSVDPVAIKTLKDYVATMKYAVDTATALAKFYKSAENTKPKTEKQPALEKTDNPPPKKKRSKKDTQQEEPAKEKPAKNELAKEKAPKEEPAKKESTNKEPAGEKDVLEEFDFLN